MHLKWRENDNGQNFNLKILFYKGRMTEGIMVYWYYYRGVNAYKQKVLWKNWSD